MACKADPRQLKCDTISRQTKDLRSIPLDQASIALPSDRAVGPLRSIATAESPWWPLLWRTFVQVRSLAEPRVRC